MCTFVFETLRDSKILASQNLAFDPICARRDTHSLAIVFRIGSSSGTADWVTHGSKNEDCFYYCL